MGAQTTRLQPRRGRITRPGMTPSLSTTSRQAVPSLGHNCLAKTGNEHGEHSHVQELA